MVSYTMRIGMVKCNTTYFEMQYWRDMLIQNFAKLEHDILGQSIWNILYLETIEEQSLWFD